MAYVKQGFTNGEVLTAAQLNHMEDGITAASDAETLGGKAPEYYSRPRNLLDNSDFSNPVNQRGQSSYTGTRTYTIDRWTTVDNASTVTIGNSGIVLTGDIRQYFSVEDTARLEGKAVTFAVKTNSELKCVTGTVVLNGSYTLIVSKSLGAGSFMIQVDAQNRLMVTIVEQTSATIEWAALYEGEYTADTLPTYIIPDKRIEMIRCGVPMQPVNLLDNSDFRNPVNQRGQTSYTGSGYSIDRWRAFHADTTHAITTSGLSVSSTGVNPNIYQIINTAGLDTEKTYTAAACDSAGNVYVWTGLLTNTTAAAPVCVYVTNGAATFRITKANAVWRWVALYEGAYTAETLPPYMPKGYAVELAECQRYYKVIPAQTLIFSSSAPNGLYCTNSIAFGRMRDGIVPTAQWEYFDQAQSGVANAFGVVQSVSFVTANEAAVIVSAETFYIRTQIASFAGCPLEINRLILRADL